MSPLIALPILLIFLYLVVTSFWPGLPLPPGPPTDPIIGHIRKMPFELQHETFAEWGRKYGGLIYARILHKPVIIINRLSVARDLIDNRGYNYSDRPRFAMYGELSIVLLPYGHRWRKHRRMMQQFFNSRAVIQHRQAQTHYRLNMLNDLLERPDDYKEHIDKAIISTVVLLSFGYRIASLNDRFVTLSNASTRAATESGTPGTTLVDLIPFLKHTPPWFPGAGFRRYATRIRKIVDESEEYPVQIVREQLEKGTARPSFVAHWLTNWTEGEDDPNHDEDVRGLASAVYIVAVETTVTTLLIMIFAIVFNQDVLRKAHEEIDRVIGNDRLPDYSDRENLPYITSIFKETLRWHPPVPLGIPHATINDDIYQGYRIPGGATVISNIWAMMHDEDVYDDPSAFRPERFMKTSSIPTTHDSTSPVYGFGRRVCPGRFFADETLWAAIACLLAVFDIKPALDENGKDILPEHKFIHGTTNRPIPFRCRITPRSEKAASLIRNSVPKDDV